MALHILVGEKEDEMRQIDDYFDLQYEDEWFDNPLVQEIIDDICCLHSVENGILTIGIPFDRSEKQIITPTDLPTSIKALISLMYFDLPFLRGSLMGNNCSKWLQRIAEDKEIYVTMNYVMHFENYPIHVLNDDSYPESEKEMAWKYHYFMYKLYNKDGVEIHDYRDDIPR